MDPVYGSGARGGGHGGLGSHLGHGWTGGGHGGLVGHGWPGGGHRGLGGHVGHGWTRGGHAGLGDHVYHGWTGGGSAGFTGHRGGHRQNPYVNYPPHPASYSARDAFVDPTPVACLEPSTFCQEAYLGDDTCVKIVQEVCSTFR